MGGSSGGYTVLNALIHFPGVFKAGVNLFGVANLFDILIGTHKFEERYNDSLVGALPAAAERYKAWSPVFHAERITDPVAVFQGADDKVVPPEHSEQIVAALRANKVPHVYKLYAGEGHGFRKTENIVDFYESLERFLKQYVLF
jgi:dipeptidyl aminopeptidase/acylaminoacyl peptidase